MPQSSKFNHWHELFALYRESDLTVADFCKLHQVRVHQFYYWRAKVYSPVPAPSSALVPVQLASLPPAQAAHEAVIRLPNGVELQGLSGAQLCALLPEVAAL